MLSAENKLLKQQVAFLQKIVNPKPSPDVYPKSDPPNKQHDLATGYLAPVAEHDRGLVVAPGSGPGARKNNDTTAKHGRTPVRFHANEMNPLL